MECRQCKLVYAQPMPVPFDIQDHYGTPPEEYWKDGYFTWDPSYFAKELAIAKNLLPFKTGMSSLDIGAGLGKSMISMKNAGFEAYGFEPSKPFYERAIAKMGINPDRLKLGMVEDMEYPDASFDFITFGAVLEHLYHPAVALEKAMRWLKPNGLVHIEVPSSRYFMQRLYNRIMRLKGTNYVMNISPMHTPFHLYEFGLASFEELGKKLNYKIEWSHFYVTDTESLPGLARPFLKKYMEWTKSGMQLTVFLRKNN